MNNRELIMPNAHSPLIRGYYGSPFEYLNKERNKKEKLWVFGPLGWEMHGYQELGYKQYVAEVVMDKVLEKSGFTREKLLDELRDLVPVARAAYPDGALQSLDEKEVIIRLSADTCLLLLVVFSILGAKPNFPDQHLIFGTGRVRENKEMWLRSIFFVGNQIPFFWVEKLMESLSYLESLRMEISMQGKPLEPLERTLFEFVIVSQVPKPVDVMHCLRSIFLGPRAPNQDKLNIWMVKSKNPLDFVKQQLSASALYKQGYIFKALHQRFGYRRIKCEHRMGMVDVYLPAIEVNDDMSLELAMTSVEKWEYVHGDRNTEYHPECTCFFNLLYNLIRTEDDVKVLSSQGVIGGVKSEHLPAILSQFYKMPLYDSECCQKMEIQKYRPQLLPCWTFYWWILSNISPANVLLMLILAFLQTGYTIAGNYN